MVTDAKPKRRERPTGRTGVALRLNVRLRPLAKMTALEDEIHGALSLKLAA
jgi:hypothetical protein